MKQILFVAVLGIFFSAPAQEISLKKGTITDTLKVNDSLSENFALYLPTNFDASKSWPILFVFDMEGRGKQVLSMFREAAEEQGYLMAASNNLNDTLSLSQNILICNRLFNAVYSLLPIHKNKTYTAGFGPGARFASLVPSFVRNVEGVISCGATVANTDVLDRNHPFYFIGITGNMDYNYPDMKTLEEILDKLRFPNRVLVFNGGHDWPSSGYLSKALEIFSLAAITKGNLEKDTDFINRTYQENLVEVGVLFTEGNALMAENAITGMIQTYSAHRKVDSLLGTRKIVKRSKMYRSQLRDQKAIFFKESLIKNDYDYYLEEDILTYNFNNLGWWKYQMEELSKYDKSTNRFEQEMGTRLRGYLNALIEDHVDMLRAEPLLDLEALGFLYMLKTITDPSDPRAFLRVISNSARMEDYGTALFYLEELLKSGFKNRSMLYEIEHTALLRITPEYNDIVEKYLKGARYDIIDE